MFFQERGVGGRGREGVCREFGEGGGAKYFFTGPKCAINMIILR